MPVRNMLFACLFLSISVSPAAGILWASSHCALHVVQPWHRFSRDHTAMKALPKCSCLTEKWSKFRTTCSSSSSSSLSHDLVRRCSSWFMAPQSFTSLFGFVLEGKCLGGTVEQAWPGATRSQFRASTWIYALNRNEGF